MRSTFYAILALFLVLSISPLANSYGAKKQPAPESVANEFYKYHFSHDMAFTSEAIKKRSKWLTSDFLKACEAYFALPQNPDEAPDIEGDVFTGSQEYPDNFSLGTVRIDGMSAYIPIIFRWKEGNHTSGVVVLKTINEKWFIDDVEFDGQDSIRKLLSTQSAPANP